MATDHAQSLRLGQRPPAPTPGVQLVTVATLPAVAYRGQIVYALDIDEFRVFDGDAWQIPTAATAPGTQTFVQATEPVADAVGDLWMKTTTYTLYVWDGSKWQVVQDADAPNRDLFTWQLAKWCVDNGVTASTKVYYIGTDPTLNPSWSVQPFELWFKTDTNQLYHYISGAWAEITDPAAKLIFQHAGYPQAVGFDQLINIYVQTGIPWANGTAGHGQDIGDIWIDSDDSNKLYGFNGLWTVLTDQPIVQNAIQAAAANAAAAAAQAAADAAQSTADSALPDGLPPSTSPTPETLSGVGLFIVKWTPITNHDPVIYEVHVSSTSGFTAGPTTLLGQTSSSQFVVKALPGSPPAPGDPDPRVLDYDTTYYVRLIAKDVDGAAAASAQASANVFRVTGVDLQADSVTAAHIVAGTITGDLLSATVLLSGSIKTATTGQRVEISTAGMQAYKSDNSLMINLPTDSTQTALVDAEVVARSLTATNGGTLRGTTTVDTAGVVSLKQVATAPASTPQMTSSYVTTMPNTSTLTDSQKTGTLGLFELIPTQVSCIEFKSFTPDYWVIHQIRTNGTRAWFFRVDTGAPFDIGGGTYFTDYPDWENHSVWEIKTGTYAGVYRMGRWIPDGVLNTYYLQSPAGLNRYSRQNNLAAPVIGSDGTNIFVAEVVLGTTNLRVRYFIPDGSGANLAGPISTTESTLGYTDSHGLCTILVGNFDIGNGRYAVAERGWNTNQRLLNVSGGAFYPGSSGNNWASADKEAESFECPTTNRRAMAWDSTNNVFWTYGGDGFMYKHTSTFWNPNTTSSTVWAEHTFYDSVGTTHESTPGPIKSFTWKRRSSIGFSMPPIPAGGVDDPNQLRTYMGRGASQPTNSNMWLQFSTSGTTATVSTITLAGTNPPTVNSFPNSTPGKITSGDGTTLVISGDGSIAGTTGTFSGAVSGTTGTFTGAVSGTTGTFSGAITTAGNTVATLGPYYYAWMNASQSVANGGTLTISNYATLASSGITLSSGVFTLPRAGRYQLYGQQYWAAQATPAGNRIAQWQQNATNVASSTVAAQNTSLTSSFSVQCGVTISASAGDTVQFKFTQNAGGLAGPLVTSRDLTFITIDWVGA